MSGDVRPFRLDPDPSMMAAVPVRLQLHIIAAFAPAAQLRRVQRPGPHGLPAVVGAARVPPSWVAMRAIDAMRTGVRDLLGVGCRVLLAGVWLYAGGAKVGDLAAATRAVKAYQLLPNGVAEWIGAGLPFAELALALLLLLGLATRAAAAVSAVLLTAFVVGIASAWARGLNIDCGCFGGGGELGAGESPNYALEIARDGLFLAAAAFLVVRPRTRWSVDGWLIGPE
jgi:uncharacterized membrane protein YphA (DoxX/SURF4 family)